MISSVKILLYLNYYLGVVYNLAKYFYTRNEGRNEICCWTVWCNENLIYGLRNLNCILSKNLENYLEREFDYMKVAEVIASIKAIISQSSVFLRKNVFYSTYQDEDNLC